MLFSFAKVRKDFSQKGIFSSKHKKLPQPVYNTNIAFIGLLNYIHMLHFE